MRTDKMSDQPLCFAPILRYSIMKKSRESRSLNPSGSTPEQMETKELRITSAQGQRRLTLSVKSVLSDCLKGDRCGPYTREVVNVNVIQIYVMWQTQ